MTKRPWAFGALTLSVVVLATACAGTPTSTPTATSDASDAALDELIAAAQAEGSLTFYASTSPGVLDVILPDFEEKYGIKVETLRLNSGDLVQRFAAEGDASAADILETPPILFRQEADKFIELSEEEVPGYDAYPADAQQGNHVYSYLTPWIIMYNTDKIAEEDVPTTWEEVIENFPGEYVLTDPRSSNSYQGWAYETTEAFGDEFAEKIGEALPELVNGGSPGAQQVAAGQTSISIPNYPGQAQELIAQGAPMAFVVPDEPAAVLAQGMGITVNAPHPNAARLFLHYRLSLESQELVCKGGAAATPLSVTGELQDCVVVLPDGWRTYEEEPDPARIEEILDLMKIG